MFVLSPYLTECAEVIHREWPLTVLDATNHTDTQQIKATSSGVALLSVILGVDDGK